MLAGGWENPWKTHGKPMEMANETELTNER